MNFVIKLAVTALAVWIAFSIVPGLDWTGSFWNLVVVALLVALANAIVKPVGCVGMCHQTPMVEIGTAGKRLSLYNRVNAGLADDIEVAHTVLISKVGPRLGIMERIDS
mgnify:CR=1 FL=1